jgi:hypothetical protein
MTRRGADAFRGDEKLRRQLLDFEIGLASGDPERTGVALGSLLADDFVEFGASGRRWDVASTREFLADRARREIVISDFEIDRLAPDVVLATYRVEGTRPSRRSSIWVHRQGRWLVRFHQGTLLPRGRPVLS